MNTSLLELETRPETQPEIAQPPTPAPRPAVHRRPPLPALTGIRTLLAIAIILFHFTPPHLGILYPFIDNGYVFVGVFFLISGYVLTYNYADRGGTLIKREFWLARFSRLYPVYLSSSSSPSAWCRTSGTHALTPSSGRESSSPRSSFRVGARRSPPSGTQSPGLSPANASSTPPSPGSSAYPGPNDPATWSSS